MRERSNEVEVERDVKVTASDGTVLLADVYHPVGIDDAPTILERTPYGRGNFASAMGPEFAAAATGTFCKRAGAPTGLVARTATSPR